MSDPIQTLVNIIRSNDLRAAKALAPALPSAMNRRNANIFWRALIDKAATLSDQGSSQDALAMAELFVAAKLDPNACLDNGDLPINVLMSRSPRLAAEAMTRLRIDLNQMDKHGRTPLVWAVDGAKSQSLAWMELVASVVANPRLRLDVADQGAYACFKGLSWIAVAAVASEPGTCERVAERLIAALMERGYDFNGARETPDVKFGSTINTPLAYGIKKAAQWLAWSPNAKASAKMGEAVWAIAQTLIKEGADPCLQMEPGAHVQLLDLCRTSSFPSGMVQSLEAGLLSQAVSAVSGQKQKTARRL